ncbi:unnamed protein product [Closterium sp. NIES-54]
MGRCRAGRRPPRRWTPPRRQPLCLPRSVSLLLRTSRMSPFPPPPLPPQVNVRVKSTPAGEEEAEEVQPTMVKSAKGAGTRQQLTREQAAAKPTKEQSATGRLAVEPTKGEKSVGTPAVLLEDAEGSNAGGNEAEQADAEEYTNSNEVEVRPRRTGRLQRPPDFFVPAAFTTVYDEVDNDLLYDDSEEDEDLPELDLDMHADPEHHWDISTMTVKEALASWKDKAMKAAMEEEICNLIGMGTWELVKRPPQVYGANYDKTYAPVSSYVTLRIFLSIVAILDLNLMQLDMKNAFLQSKLDRVLYMY